MPKVMISPSPCPKCKTSEYVYVVPSLKDHTKFQCICNVCGAGESSADSDTEAAAIRFWNESVCSQSPEYQELRKKYEQFKLQWMIDHGYTLRDLVEELQTMVDEDLDGSDVPTSLQSLFGDWEFGVGFTGGSVWPCFEEWFQNDGAKNSDIH